MAIRELPLIKADVVALDVNDDPVLVAEVKANAYDREAAKEQLIAYLRSTPTRIPFAMLVDQKHIQIFRWDGTRLSEPVDTASTDGILTFYSPEFPEKKIFEYYMIGLVEAWLRDVAYHWKSANPPHFHELQSIGLAELLERGTTKTEVPLRLRT